MSSEFPCLIKDLGIQFAFAAITGHVYPSQIRRGLFSRVPGHVPSDRTFLKNLVLILKFFMKCRGNHGHFMEGKIFLKIFTNPKPQFPEGTEGMLIYLSPVGSC
jgi:hypothetical protein